MFRDAYRKANDSIHAPEALKEPREPGSPTAWRANSFPPGAARRRLCGT